MTNDEFWATVEREAYRVSQWPEWKQRGSAVSVPPHKHSGLVIVDSAHTRIYRVRVTIGQYTHIMSCNGKKMSDIVRNYLDDPKIAKLQYPFDTTRTIRSDVRFISVTTE